MNREEIILKWLRGDATPEELKFLRDSGDLDALERIDAGLERFKAPAYDVESELKRTSAFRSQKSGKQVFWRPLLRVAAVITLLISAYFLFINDPSVTMRTAQGEISQFYLPDSSHVDMNASSSIVYNPSNWDKSRFLRLDGEAFFKVRPGSRFDVETAYGTIRVVGTAFNIRARNDYFEVICAEGKVAVLQGNTLNELTQGKRLRVIEGSTMLDEVENYQKLITGQPYNESHFESVPLGEVIDELERQFSITIEGEEIDESVLFTGTFTHNDMDVALKTVLLPLDLSYQVKDNKVILEDSAEH